MLGKFNTRGKLFLFPILFILIVIFSGFVYNYFSSIANARNNVAISTEEFIQQNLKGRISVYQFLKTPSENNIQNVVNNFKKLDEDVVKLKSILVDKKNIQLSEEVLKLSNNYMKFFDDLSQERLENFKLGNLEESLEIQNRISEMVNIGLELENKLIEINTSAVELREEAYETLNIDLVILAIFSIITFVIISMLISNSIIRSINNFKEGLLGFFAYLNRESNTTELLEDSSKDEFGQMAKVVNQNIIKTKAGIEEDRKLIDETISVLSEFEQGDLCQRLNISVSNPAL
ncbi:chemotaxis protein, partial [Arcobacter sp. FW59]